MRKHAGGAEAANEGDISKDAGAAGAPDASAKKARVKGGKYIPVGIVHIKASFNNTQVSVTDPRGALISWSNAGRCGFKGSRKSTAYAATMVAQEASRQAVAQGMHEVEVQVQDRVPVASRPFARYSPPA
jgi:small subunit ribosomal protein S11